MSFLGRGRGRGRGRRGRRTAALVVAGTMMAFQALAVVGALPASAAVTTCDFSSGVLSVTVDAVPTVFTRDAASNILIDGVETDDILLTNCDAQTGATTANTTAISITGGAADEDVTIDVSDGAVTRSFGAINWTVSLGSSVAPATDDLVVTNAGSADSTTIDLGASGIDLNGDGDLDVTLSGVDGVSVAAGDGDDTINAGGSTATGAAFPTAVTITGGAGEDTLTGGAGNDTIDGGLEDDTIAGGGGDDDLDGQANGATGDTVDYSGSTTAVIVNLNVNATGQGLDLLAGFENVIGSPQGDTLNGDAGVNVITPGAGNDTVSGGGGDDMVDYSDSAAAVTVNIDTGTASGNGTDTLTSIEDVQGSAFADTLSGDENDNELFGGGGNDLLAGLGGDDDLVGEGGVDTADYSWSTTEEVELVLNDCDSDGFADVPTSGATTSDDIESMENAILTANDDSFEGNHFGNLVRPMGGQNALNGDSTDTDCSPSGGDTLDYSVGYTAGVTVNMAGGATAGDSAVNFENAIGTAFADNFTGNEVSNTLKGGGGNDSMKGGTGDDTLKGGRGNDSLRGGAGDDDLFGGKGKNDAAFGGSGTDLCRGAEIRRSCEIG